MRAPFDLRQVEVFLTLCEEGSFTRAAERIGISPSRASQVISALEAAVGGRLFDRTSRRVTITPLGEHLRDGLQPGFADMVQAYAAVRQIATGIGGTMRLGMYSPISAGPHLLNIIKAFEAAHPGARVRTVDTGFDADPRGLLHAGGVDVIATRLPLAGPDLVQGPVLSREHRVVVVAADHELAGRESVRYDDLAPFVVADHPALPRELMDAFIPPRTPSGAKLRRVCLSSFSDVRTAVGTGEIVHPTVPSFLDLHGHPGITAVPISDLPPSETALVWLADDERPVVRAFAATAGTVTQGGPARERPPSSAIGP